MLRTEFEQLTGFYPSENLYTVIEAAYMASPGGKEEFCRLYKANTDGLAEKIQIEANLKEAKAAREAEEESTARFAQVKTLEKQVEDLKKRLYKAEGWTPYNASKLTDSEYDGLREFMEEHTDGAFCGHESPLDWICDEFGFDPNKVKIIDTIPRYEKSRENIIRRTGEFEERKPAYCATDWNYARFDVGAWQYEVVNGDLYMYFD